MKQYAEHNKWKNSGISLLKQMQGNFQLIVQELEWLASLNSPVFCTQLINKIYKGVQIILETPRQLFHLCYH